MQLSKESRQALSATGGRPAEKSSSKDYAHLDKTSQAADEYLQKRSDELDRTLADLKEMRVAKEEENERLLEEVERMEAEVAAKRELVAAREEEIEALEDRDRFGNAT